MQDEQSSLTALNRYLQEQGDPIAAVNTITRFTGGYSNLTYLLQTNGKEYVLRMPPHGANIKSAHDMGREFRVLHLLKPHYAKVPTPVLYCESADIIGAPFYIMEKLEGIILRAQNAPKMQIPAATFQQLSGALVDNLAALHALDIERTGLVQLGKPEGYVQRQVEGWVKRYYAAETDKIDSMDVVAQWLRQHLPPAQAPAFLHNDYKYDNLLLDPDDLTRITGVLDWEMSTVGDPLMDLGASLAYWFEAGEEEVFKNYNLTWLPGNYTRRQVIDRYAATTGRDLSNISFYYVFGLFKNAVIAQQIYHRWKQGHSSDPRFGALLPMIQLLGKKAAATIEKETL
ncbi:MAG: phosphotransferase family protein [Bacteroidota bacterium]|nr:phosphotransferase family protein [Bacteroidota bacterium]